MIVKILRAYIQELTAFGQFIRVLLNYTCLFDRVAFIVELINIERPGKSFAHFPAVLSQKNAFDIAHCREIGNNAFGIWIYVFLEAYTSGVVPGHSHI